MMMNDEQSFDAPIPGMSLVAELGARPWQNPPRFSTVEDTVDYYIERMSTDEFSQKLISTLEMGVPVTTIADVMSLTSIMEGIHSADIGVLVSPVLVEFMMLIADGADIEYKTGLEDTKEPSKAAINRAVLKFKQEQAEQESEPETPVEVAEVSVKEEPVGLMARRNK